MRPERIGVLFVCMGNICRSPMAKGVFDHLAFARGIDMVFDIDSCGTSGFHVGEPADPRTIGTLCEHGVPLQHRARRFDAAHDLPRFTHILVMDQANLRQLSLMGCPPNRVRLLREFDPALKGSEPGGLEVPDPYYGGEDGFEKIYTMIHAACAGLLAHLLVR